MLFGLDCLLLLGFFFFGLLCILTMPASSSSTAGLADDSPSGLIVVWYAREERKWKAEFSVDV